MIRLLCETLLPLRTLCVKSSAYRTWCEIKPDITYIMTAMDPDFSLFWTAKPSPNKSMMLFILSSCFMVSGDAIVISRGVGLSGVGCDDYSLRKISLSLPRQNILSMVSLSVEIFPASSDSPCPMIGQLSVQSQPACSTRHPF
jgi:hypothetical protein